MSSWKEYVLGDVVTFQRGFDITRAEQTEGKYPVVSSSGIGSYHSEWKVEGPGVVIGRKGTLGTVHYLKGKFWPHDTTLWVKDFHGNSPLFISYYLKLMDLGSHDVGSSNPTLNRNHIHRLPVRVPQLHEQESIATILSNLDDKIDLLHRQNKTLEAMAETQFRQWFVEESGKDWERVSLLNFIELIGGGTPKTSVPEYWDGEIPWLSGGDIATNHKGIVDVAERRITREGLNNSSAKLLPKWATVITARGTVGKYALLGGEMAFSQSNYGILPRIEKCYFFTYLLVGRVVEELQAAAYGSVFDTITTATFREATFAMPPITKVTKFEGFIKPYFDKKLKNEIQIRTLESLRDTLLPKLMSGEVRVRYRSEPA